VFLDLARSAAHVVRSGTTRAQNIDTLFFMLEWVQCRSRTRVLHVDRSAGHILRPGHETSTHYFSCSGGAGTDPIKTHRNMLWGTCVFASDAIYVSRSAFWCVRCTKRQCTIFHAWVGSVWIPQEVHTDIFCRTLAFALGAICGSCSVFGCVRGVKQRHTIFRA
jgi:hypothetical protein